MIRRPAGHRKASSLRDMCGRATAILVAASGPLTVGCTLGDAVLGGLNAEPGILDSGFGDAGGRGADDPPDLQFGSGLDAGWSAGDAERPDASLPRESECGIGGPRLSWAAPHGALRYEGCAATFAETTFLNALCTCGSASLGDSLKTRGYDSRTGADVTDSAGGTGAPVGINRAFELALGQADIGGSFAVAGADPLDLPTRLLVRGDFRAAGNVRVLGGVATVARNAWFGADFLGLGVLTVGGELHHQGTVNALLLQAHTTVREAVAVEPPCPCANASQVPIDALVTETAQRNDNAAVGLDSSSLRELDGVARLTLPCGRYYLETVSGTGRLELRASGKAALFVNGDISLDGELNIQLDPGAELDLWVRGTLRSLGPGPVGDPLRPAALRIYVQGESDLALPSALAGNLYAPKARLRAVGEMYVRGSLFVGELVSLGTLQIAYDRAVLSANSGCEQAVESPTCERCGWCSGGLACVAGVCGACRGDTDCCSQSVCSEGRCVSLVTLL